MSVMQHSHLTLSAVASCSVEDCDGCLSNKALPDRPFDRSHHFHFLSQCVSLHTTAVLNAVG